MTRSHAHREFLSETASRGALTAIPKHLQEHLVQAQQHLIGVLAKADSRGGNVQRKCGSSCGCASCRAEQWSGRPETVLTMQRLIGNQATQRLLAAQRVRNVVTGQGEELDPAMRLSMEQRFGDDFSDVRIHRDSEAAASASAIDALAYTAGSHIVFGQGQYDVSSSDGQRTLAHELTHVIQQRSGPVSGVPIHDDLFVSEPDDPFEKAAEQKADEVMAGLAPVEGKALTETSGAFSRMTTQRQDDDSETDTETPTAAEIGPIEQIATSEDIAYLEQLAEEGSQSTPAAEDDTLQTLSVQTLSVQRGVFTCFGDKANIAAATAALVAAGATGIAALLAPDPTTLTKWVALGLAAGVIAAIAWLISAIQGLVNCYRAQDDAAQHQREIESLQRQIDQLRRTQEQLERARQ